MEPADAFITGLPKAELHVHLEGCLEADLLFELATRNDIKLRWDTPEALRAAYRFGNLQAFLDLYYEGCRVLLHARDLYDLTRDYLRRAHADGVVRAEILLAPQNFTLRGMPIEAVMDGVLSGMRDAAREHGISAGLLIGAQRHRSEAEALQLLEAVMPWADQILGFGLGGAEIGNPPSGFVQYFRTARDRGFRVTAHAGEEGPASYVREAVELLNVDRIDHGNACLDDPTLVRDLADRAIPLTVCPLSNVRLCVVPSLAEHPLRAMLDATLFATLNSDDPAYFGGSINENFIQCRDALGLSQKELVMLARNSLTACFMPAAYIADAVARLDAYVATQAPLSDLSPSSAPRTPPSSPRTSSSSPRASSSSPRASSSSPRTSSSSPRASSSSPRTPSSSPRKRGPMRDGSPLPRG
jgi:adenosine deaminase